MPLHIGLTHALSGPRPTVLGKRADWLSLGQISAWTNQAVAGGRTTVLAIGGPFPMYQQKENRCRLEKTREMFSFLMDTSYLSSQTWLPGLCHILSFFPLTSTLHDVAFPDLVNNLGQDVWRGEFLSQWCRASLFWSFFLSPNDAHFPFYNSGRSGSLGEGKWKGQMMKLTVFFWLRR